MRHGPCICLQDPSIGEISVRAGTIPGAGGVMTRQIDQNQRVAGHKLRPLFEIWPEVGSALRLEGFDAIQFVERVFQELGCTLYLIDDCGVFYACDAENVDSQITDLGVSNAAHDFAQKNKIPREQDGGESEAWNFRVTQMDYLRIIEYARAVADGRLLQGVVDHVSGFRVDYPPELSIAIEAFTAVSLDPKALVGRSPRQALLRWLEENKPEIGRNARERIATVANWQPEGGAPQTPGG